GRDVRVRSPAEGGGRWAVLFRRRGRPPARGPARPATVFPRNEWPPAGRLGSPGEDALSAGSPKPGTLGERTETGVPLAPLTPTPFSRGGDGEKPVLLRLSEGVEHGRASVPHGFAPLRRGARERRSSPTGTVLLHRQALHLGG